MNTVFHIIPLNKTETWAQQTAPSKIIGTNQWDRQLEDGGQLCTQVHFHHRLYTRRPPASGERSKRDSARLSGHVPAARVPILITGLPVRSMRSSRSCVDHKVTHEAV